MKKQYHYFVVFSIYFHVLLFTYAAVSKLLDFENFQIQMKDSPLLSPFSEFLPLFIIAVELFLVGLLCYQKTQNIGLLGSFILMLIFTVYIGIMLVTSENLPCSCGGILEKMTWTQHFYFNIGCTILIAFALVLNKKYNRPVDGDRNHS